MAHGGVGGGAQPVAPARLHLVGGEHGGVEVRDVRFVDAKQAVVLALEKTIEVAAVEVRYLAGPVDVEVVVSHLEDQIDHRFSEPLPLGARRAGSPGPGATGADGHTLLLCLLRSPHDRLHQPVGSLLGQIRLEDDVRDLGQTLLEALELTQNDPLLQEPEQATEDRDLERFR